MQIIGNYKVVRPANHEAWLEERKKGIGSSEVGTLMGVNSFDTPLRLWRRKMHIDPPTEETDVMALGHAVEGGVAYMFARATGAIIDPDSTNDWLAVCKEKEYLRVSPDRLFWLPDTPESERTMANALMLECKTTSHFIDKDNIPDYWYCQIQYQMGILGLEKCAIAWISASGGRWSFNYTWVNFNKAFFNLLVTKLTTFWEENILGEKEPDVVLDAEDIKYKYPDAVKDKTLEMSPDVEEDREFLEKLKRYASLCDQIKSLESEKDLLKGQMADRIKDNEKVVFDGEKIISFGVQKGKTTLDTKKFKEEEPEMYNKYLTSSSSFRVFKVLGGLNNLLEKES